MNQLTITDKEILNAALMTFVVARQSLDERIELIKKQLGGRPAAKPSGKTERILSPEARRRIATAQKKRWAAYRKNKKS